MCDAVNSKIEREVEEYEDMYRGRELPGFINYKTFEVMVKEQIKQLEEPAVRKLKDIGGKWKHFLSCGYMFLSDRLFIWLTISNKNRKIIIEKL